MICYRDRSYCGSKVKKHTCGREFVPDEAYWEWSRAIGRPDGGPIAFMELCKEGKK